MSNPFRAHNPVRNWQRRIVLVQGKSVLRALRWLTPTVFQGGRSKVAYPVVPHNYPNRAVRRAVAAGRLQSLPGEWRAYFVQQPELRRLMEVR